MSPPDTQTPHDDDPAKTAKTLAKHSIWMGVGFMAIILVAIVLELFWRGLIRARIFEINDPVVWAIRLGSYSLLLIDLALLIGTVGKQSWRLLKNV